MTAQKVDAARVRRALARLDRIAVEHPDLTSAEARERLDAWIEAEPEEKEADTGQQAGDEK